ncbi:MAG: hypothetical protein JSR34_02905 [Proteobacteria bacterium]|nr:hypothetical protein [Pseudomonadota bacterium]
MSDPSFYLATLALFLGIVAGWRINLLQREIKLLRAHVTNQLLTLSKLEATRAS